VRTLGRRFYLIYGDAVETSYQEAKEAWLEPYGKFWLRDGTCRRHIDLELSVVVVDWRHRCSILWSYYHTGHQLLENVHITKLVTIFRQSIFPGKKSLSECLISTEEFTMQ